MNERDIHEGVRHSPRDTSSFLATYKQLSEEDEPMPPVQKLSERDSLKAQVFKEYGPRILKNALKNQIMVSDPL